MPVSHDLQDIISGVSAAIAERQSWGRTELEQLRRSLNEAARGAGKAERAAIAGTGLIDSLVGGIEQGVADLAGLASRARAAQATGPEAGAAR